MSLLYYSITFCTILAGSMAGSISSSMYPTLTSGNPYMVTFASMNQIIQMKTNEVGKCIILLIVGFLVTLQVLVVTF
jgi:hypothetical protein